MAGETVDVADDPYDAPDDCYDEADDRYDEADDPYDVADDRYDTTDDRYDEADDCYDTADDCYDVTDDCYDVTDDPYDVTDDPYDIADDPYDVTDDLFDVAGETLGVIEECGDVIEDYRDITGDCGDIIGETGDVAGKCGDVTEEYGDMAGERGDTAEDLVDATGEILDVTEDGLDTPAPCPQRALRAAPYVSPSFTPSTPFTSPAPTSPMKLTFWGAARTVTGSMHLLELESGARLLLDCGLYQGRREDANAINRSFPAEPASIDAVLLSHAHIDHSGLLPRLYREGFRGRVYATHATYDLCALMLLDSAHIQESDARFFNEKIRKKGEDRVEPLYDHADAEGVLDLFVGVGYRAPFRPVEGVEVEYRDAGHILGSATMTLTVTEGGTTKRLGFTGDVGNPGRPILRNPQWMADCDWLITESTYGGETHPPPDRAKDALAEVITRTAARGGKVVIPAFAVGRTQEIVYALDQLWNEERIPRIPVFVDSPLAVNATAVYQAHPECYDRPLREYLRTDPDPFGFERLEYVRDAARSKQLNDMNMPFVVISASGMAEHGRILHHLTHTIEDPRNTVVIVGFMAEHTLGRRLVERRETVNIFGRPHARRAEVVVLNYYSAHADEPGLLDFIGKMDRERLQRVFLVHGDPDRQELLAQALGAQGYRGVECPHRGRTVTL